MKRSIVIIFSIFSAFVLQAQPDSVYKTIEQANELYKQDKFKQAAELYEQVLSSGYEAAELYYNLGNAYFRQNQLAKAILNYERALRLAPNNKKIKDNLEFARQFVPDKFEQVHEFFLKRWWRKLSLSLSADTWARISVAFFVLVIFGLWLFLFSHKISLRKAGFFTAFLALFFSLMTLWLSLDNKNYFIGSKEAIILDTTSVRSSPSDDGTELFILHEGVKVKILSQNDGWYEVKLPNGSIGWVETSYLEKI